MTEQSLINLMYRHLKNLGLPCDLDIKLKGYSKNYSGRYNTNTKEVMLYHLEEDGSLIDLDYLLSVVRHEAIHHYQWKHEKSFTRLHGVMHNIEFLRLEKVYNYKYSMMKGRYIN